MKQFIWAGLALQLCAASALAQRSPATTPSTPPVTTPPAAGEHPPTGGPNSPPTAEPANVIDRSGITPGANSFTEAQARDRLRNTGYAEVSALTKDPDGVWRGSAIRNGSQVRISVDSKGHVATN